MILDCKEITWTADDQYIVIRDLWHKTVQMFKTGTMNNLKTVTALYKLSTCKGTVSKTVPLDTSSLSKVIRI